MALTLCPECKKEISSTAEACPHCGFTLKPKRKWNPGTAAVLSLIIPGAGQVYQDRILWGLIWLVVVVLGYVMFIIPGIVLHILCVISAAATNPYPK